MQNDLISRSALIDYVKELPTWEARDTGFFTKKYPRGFFTPDDIVKSIQNAPAVDAVEVVRCKECKFYETGVEYYGGGTKDICRLLKRQMLDDDFCSYGERRADE